ncbi:MAG TPA: hypothetical protein VE175_10435, partial [Woeseiaceae bacterium]|nr:hypothetical protein [Woeseiaceae bacterium]
MIARSVRILAATVLLLVGLTIVAGAVIWHWLLHTDAGAAWLWESARAAAPGELSAVAFEGTLTGGFELSNLSYAGESLSVKASRVRLAIHADLLPPSLDVENVQVTDVLMRQLERPEPRRAERGGRFSPANLALPFKVALGKLVLERLRILSPDGAAIVTVDRAEIAGRWDESIVLSRLDVASSADAVQGSAKLSLQKPFEASASLEVTYPLQVGTDTVPLAFAAAASGTLADLAVRITGHEPDITIEGRLLDLLDAPAWDLAARSPGLQWPPGNVKPALSLRELAVASHGKPSRYALEANGIVTVAAGGALRFSLEGAGDPGGIEVQRLRLDGPMLTAESRGGVSWSNG